MKNGVLEVKFRQPFGVPGDLHKNGQNQALFL